MLNERLEETYERIFYNGTLINLTTEEIRTIRGPQEFEQKSGMNVFDFVSLMREDYEESLKSLRQEGGVVRLTRTLESEGHAVYKLSPPSTREGSFTSYENNFYYAEKEGKGSKLFFKLLGVDYGDDEELLIRRGAVPLELERKLVERLGYNPDSGDFSMLFKIAASERLRASLGLEEGEGPEGLSKPYPVVYVK